MDQRKRDNRRRQAFETGHRAHTVRTAQEAAQRATDNRRQVSVSSNVAVGRGGNSGKGGQ